MARAIKLVDIAGDGQLQVTAEGLEFLMQIEEPVGVVCLVGPTHVGKSFVANLLVQVLNGFTVARTGQEGTKGIWVWSELITVQSSESSPAYKLLVLDTEGLYKARPEVTASIFTIAVLISSNLLYFSLQSIPKEALEQLAFLADLQVSLQVSKGNKTNASLPQLMPKLTWVVAGSPSKTKEPALTFLERVLSFEGMPETKLSKIRLVIKQLFPKKSCVYLCSPVLNDSDLARVCDLTPEQLSTRFIEQAQELIRNVYTGTELKEVGTPVTGSVIAQMLSIYADKINKKRPLIITNIVTTSVASEARRIKEHLMITYFEQMNGLERRLPIDEEDIVSLHAEKFTQFLRLYDSRIAPMLSRPEVQEERKNLEQRMEDYVRDLKETNYNKSFDHCQAVFRRLFDGLLTNEDRDPIEIERTLNNSIKEYNSIASGPCVDLIIGDNLAIIINYCMQTLRRANIEFRTTEDCLKAEVDSLRNRIKVYEEAETSLQNLVKEVSTKAAKSMEAKDLQITELTAAINARVQAAETKIRELTREHQSIKIELEQAQKEKQLLAQTHSEIHEKRLQEAEKKQSKTVELNTLLACQIESLRRDHESILAEKNLAINELTRRIKQLETQAENTPRQDAIILMSMKDYLEGIQSNFMNDQMSRKKAVQYMEQCAMVQSELNKTRLAEQSQRIRLAEEYEQKLAAVRKQLDEIRQKYAVVEQTCNAQAEALRLLQQKPIRADEPQVNAKIEVESKPNLLENHLEIQFELIDSQKQTIEALREEIDQKVELISKLKYDVISKEDDNDMLLQVINGALEFTKKQRTSLRNLYGAMHNPDLKTKVEHVLSKHKVPFI